MELLHVIQALVDVLGADKAGSIASLFSFKSRSLARFVFLQVHFFVFRTGRILNPALPCPHCRITIVLETTITVSLMSYAATKLT